MSQPLSHRAIELSSTMLALTLMPSAVGACPGCKEALLDPGQALEISRAAQGYNWSIGALILVPLLLLVSLGLRLVWAVRSGKRSAPRVG